METADIMPASVQIRATTDIEVSKRSGGSGARIERLTTNMLDAQLTEALTEASSLGERGCDVRQYEKGTFAYSRVSMSS